MAPSQKLLDCYKEYSNGTAQLYAWNKQLIDSDLLGIGELTKLTKIDLHQNKLKSIPPELSNLTNLTGLNLSQNKLNSIPPELSNLTNLTQLNLWENKLNSIPLEFKNLKKLEYLWLYDNPNMIFPPKEILEKANANINKTYEEWKKLGKPKANPQIIKEYLETKEAEELFTELFPPSSFLQDISNMFSSSNI